jgi:hypothetical protein
MNGVIKIRVNARQGEDSGLYGLDVLGVAIDLDNAKGSMGDRAQLLRQGIELRPMKRARHGDPASRSIDEHSQHERRPAKAAAKKVLEGGAKIIARTPYGTIRHRSSLRAGKREGERAPGLRPGWR